MHQQQAAAVDQWMQLNGNTPTASPDTIITDDCGNIDDVSQSNNDDDDDADLAELQSKSQTRGAQSAYLQRSVSYSLSRSRADLSATPQSKQTDLGYGQRSAPERVQGVQNVPHSAWVKTDIVSQHTSRMPFFWQRRFLPTRCEVHSVTPVTLPQVPTSGYGITAHALLRTSAF